MNVFSSTSLKVGLTISDRVMPLLDGSVRHPDFHLDLRSTVTEEIFRGILAGLEFEAAEMSLATHCILLSRGDTRLVGIPIFPSRMFRHGSIYVNRRSGIRRPEDLAGKRVGVPEFQMTAAVWIRGFLEQDYGVDSRSIRWTTAGLNVPREGPRISLQATCYDVTHRADVSLNHLLVSNEIDALITASAPKAFVDRQTEIARLIRNVRDVEVQYFQRYKIFPIMHLIVLRRELYERHQDLTISLFNAFLTAKDLAMQRVNDPNFLSAMVPWLHEEIEETRKIMGEDFWPYGLQCNRQCLDVFLGHLKQQDLLAKDISVEDLFAREVLNT
jgi:4,5-dihydroxyphthalate decarboxylase